ncbi:MAG: stage II sporulation protein M [Candidatus Dadabacteria bacterium]
MREGLFIKKNKARWEKIQSGRKGDADEMATNFIQLVDDLAYAKTFYPSSRVTHYINALASRIYLGIYQNRKENINRLSKFWKYDVPLTIYKHRRIILFSFLVFCTFYIVGFFSARQDDGFIRQVLGDGYVDLTEKNIEEGNPFGIYQSGNSFFSWIGIMINNIMVSFVYFGKGIFLGIFSTTALAKESMRVGVFHYMFFAKGYGTAFILAVMIHGLLELTSIIIACAAGVIMGTSYLFPGTRTRLDAFRDGVKEGAKILIGLIPILVVAAFYEGFVTRHYKMPIALNIILLSISAVFIAWYFVLYPKTLKRRSSVI